MQIRLNHREHRERRDGKCGLEHSQAVMVYGAVSSFSGDIAEAPGTACERGEGEPLEVLRKVIWKSKNFRPEVAGATQPLGKRMWCGGVLAVVFGLYACSGCRPAAIGGGEDSGSLAAGGRSGSATGSFKDPRNDRGSLESMMSELNSGDFSEGYARLVRAAGHSGRAGWRGNGVASLRGTAGPVSGSSSSDVSGLERLVAELLGATLVDAQDELWLAWSALERAGVPEQELKWMTEPPPWPSASVSRMIGRQGEAGLSMLETLAEEVAPLASTRAWLTLSWVGNPEAIGMKRLREVAEADDGRLLAEPRFRAWLRAEWTAWARQRYRRVTRSLEVQGGGDRGSKR
jgi:hypothetical protein